MWLSHIEALIVFMVKSPEDAEIKILEEEKSLW